MHLAQPLLALRNLRAPTALDEREHSPNIAVTENTVISRHIGFIAGHDFGDPSGDMYVPVRRGEGPVSGHAAAARASWAVPQALPHGRKRIAAHRRPSRVRQG